VDETLYRTKNGRFFLAGEGGALSKYARTISPTCSAPGEDLRPLTDREALEWLEEKGKVSLIERLFPEAIEDA
jgi:hypothetical protein